MEFKFSNLITDNLNSSCLLKWQILKERIEIQANWLTFRTTKYAIKLEWTMPSILMLLLVTFHIDPPTVNK